MAFIPLYDDNPHRYIGRLGQGITLGIIILTSAIYVVFQSGWLFAVDEDKVLSFGLIPAVFNGEVARPEEFLPIPPGLTLVTHAFLHGDIWHLLGNMIFLWVFGDNVEDAVGHWRFILFYALAAVGGGLAQVLIMPHSEAVVIGASGAVAAIIAAYLMLYPRAKIWVLVFGRIPIRLSAVWVLGAWILWQVWIITTKPEDNIAWWVHIGGLLSGALMILVLRRPGLHLFGRMPPVPPPLPGPALREPDLPERALPERAMPESAMPADRFDPPAANR
jgi:membrane associated rhomboid family serine protease